VLQWTCASTCVAATRAARGPTRRRPCALSCTIFGEVLSGTKAYRDQGLVKGQEFYDGCATFCLEYDQPSFGPCYDTDSLESVSPLVAEVLGRKPFWWEPKGKAEEELGPKCARLAFGYLLASRDEKALLATITFYTRQRRRIRV